MNNTELQEVKERLAIIETQNKDHKERTDTLRSDIKNIFAMLNGIVEHRQELIKEILEVKSISKAINLVMTEKFPELNLKIIEVREDLRIHKETNGKAIETMKRWQANANFFIRRILPSIGIVITALAAFFRWVIK